jgi:hypothetical protein
MVAKDMNASSAAVSEGVKIESFVNSRIWRPVFIDVDAFQVGKNPRQQQVVLEK